MGNNGREIVKNGPTVKGQTIKSNFNREQFETFGGLCVNELGQCSYPSPSLPIYQFHINTHADGFQ